MQNMFKVNDLDTRTYFVLFCSVYFSKFEQVNFCWVKKIFFKIMFKVKTLIFSDVNL